ncbi:MAG: ImmA/IrrE family metallo-endopeptidase [bacterium]
MYNSSYAKTRQTNDIMHELSHIIIGHKPQTTHYSQDTGILLRQYDKNQEDEADCLASILIYPKDVLMKIKFSDTPLNLASKSFGGSQKLLEMRLDTSGVNIIYNRTRNKSITAKLT